MKLKFSWVIIVGFLHTQPVIDEHIGENSWIPSWNRTIGQAKGTITWFLVSTWGKRARPASSDLATRNATPWSEPFTENLMIAWC